MTRAPRRAAAAITRSMSLGGSTTAAASAPPTGQPRLPSPRTTPRTSWRSPVARSPCTGGSLLIGTVGRPDLVEPALTARPARARYDSAHRGVDVVDVLGGMRASAEAGLPVVAEGAGRDR
ncbi:hypothetical protein ACFXDO_15755 [Streptomyces nigra]|uniref:hypothetical protein n=1 Tax=Streptomyces nigra TaxID=1827580 RepID=UPI00367F22F1